MLSALGDASWAFGGLLALVLMMDNAGNAIIAIASGEKIGEVLAGNALAGLISALSFAPPAVVIVLAANLRTRPTYRAAALVAAVVVGAAAGAWISERLSDYFWPGSGEPDADVRVSELKVLVWKYGGGLGSIGLFAAAAALYRLFVRDREAAEALSRAELARVALDRQMTEARLQVLHAQIEPHFLFNTMANVRRLYETDPPRGHMMLRHLTAYLGAALPDMRVAQSTLERELASCTAYLSVQKIRMGERLSFDVVVADELRSAIVPPMVLLTLVENAVKHGIAPLAVGGAIGIRARVEGEILRLQVVDTGCGIVEGSGSGVGLSNLRMRVGTLFGTAGSVLLEPNTPTGCIATLELPVEWANSSEAAQ